MCNRGESVVKGINPAVATVIIVSIAIAISIAVAMYLTGITSGFTQTENLDIVSAVVTGSPMRGYMVNITVHNTGTVDATITDIIIGGKSYKEYNAELFIAKNNTLVPVKKCVLKPGEQETIVVKIPPGKTITFASSDKVNIMIISSSNRRYPYMALYIPA